MSTVTPPAPPPGLQTIVDQILSAIPALNGYKTYISAAGFALVGLYQLLIAKDIPGGIQSLLAALAAVGLRHAIAKSA